MAPKRPSDDLAAGILFVSFLLLPLACVLIHYIIKCIVSKRLAQRVAEVTTSPTIPKWTRHGSRSVQFDNGIRLECQAYQKIYKNDRYSQGECSQKAIMWIRRQLAKKYAKGSVTVPNMLRIISVPMKNFKCGTSCTDFQPLSGMAPGAFLNYQMCGDQKIQVTRYVENGVSYVAGYCVYVKKPYERSWGYKKMHIDNCYTGPEYALRDVQQRMPKSPIVDLQLEKRMRETSKTLKVSFCESLKQPVMIGFDDGVIKHFQWQEATKTYKMNDCSSCKLTELEDDPPAYHLLEV